MSKADNAKVTVNLRTLEEDSFDLDYDGEEYDGGSYNIYDDGSVVNHAVTPNEIYGTSDSSVEDFIKGLKKPIKESFLDAYDENSEELDESKITLKRQYTESYPAKTTGKYAAVRNKIIEALKDGELTKEEFDTLVSGLTEDSKRWLRRNSTFFNIQEDKVGLTKSGQKIAAALFQAEDVNSNLKTNENNNTNMETKFIYESFSEFVNSIDESFELVSESFKSSMLAGLFTRQGTFDANLAKAFYGATKLKLDQIEDEDLISTSPALAYKNKLESSIVFYISDVEKPNTYAPSDAFYTNKTIPGEGYLLAVASGDNKFYDNVWTGGRWDRNPKNRTLKQVDNNPSDSIGINKKYSGWDATGLYNVKRISEVADRAIVINTTLLRQKYSAEAQRADRAAAKKGAIAFKSDKDFKAENMARYNQIIAQKATQMPMDSLVSKAIERMSEQIKDGLAKQTKGRYGEIIVGTNAKGAEAKLADVANHMQRILDDYSGYVRVVAQQEDSVAKYGEAESWYKREVEQKAKELKDRLDKIESFSYIW
jgi:hypothetical protein